MTTTLYWHDYETWGSDPKRDRAAQFAGVRTDTELNIIGKPLIQYCRPAQDMLPHPDACLVTGITPQHALKEGVCEAEFMAQIHREFIHPGTCGVGYNNLRFDDEFTRYGFYRNFFDPYGREWQHGNSRWDIIDMVRLTHALRPEGIQWPSREDGTTSFRLEELTAANDIEHLGAHDALADVYATIDLARLIKEKQPRLYDYLFQLRHKQKVLEQLNLKAQEPILHVSSMYPAASGCIAPVLPLVQHPTNSNGVIVFDLRHNPEPLFELSVEEIQQRLFVATSKLPDGAERIPLKTVHINKCPVIAPLATMNPPEAEKWQIDLTLLHKHADMLRGRRSISDKISRVHEQNEFPAITDPDQNLYGGGFFSSLDRRKMDDLIDMSPEALQKTRTEFDDPRIPEMVFRYRARNWPDSLTKEEKIRWDRYRQNRLTNPAADCGITLAEYQKQLAEKVMHPDTSGRDRALLSELADWPSCINIEQTTKR